ncbi:MAG: lysylphosphatidylglycerol synthase domain-containing protein [Xenococcaceae cyanobacterium MO_188.B29]|nr:lysylphosphatidylglycerol synthase domain-containing protein [Xenococcaceae cyanobacterium MO_188.B29]
MFKKILSTIKPYLRWFILGGTLFFLLTTLKNHWQEVTAVQIDLTGWLMLAAALGVTLLAHIWSGWVWTWILAAFQQSLGRLPGIGIYLTTNIAKYLPGNVWHFYGRIAAVSKSGGSLGAATLSVLLEPLLMASAALVIALVSTGLGWLKTDVSLEIGMLQIPQQLQIAMQMAGLITVLVGIHPRILNPLMHWLSRSKGDAQAAKKVNLHSYPLVPLLGEIGFLIFRGTGFLLTLMAIAPILPQQVPQLISAFSFAWLLGLVVPGAPGGMGIFEATTIALLDSSQFSPATILSTVACFRVVSILAEAIAALIAWFVNRATQI